MADILIRGMNKPHNCFRCVLSHLRGERLFCYITKDEVLRSKIAPDCPLHELPEHGDLIDICNAENALFVAGNYHLNDYRQGWNDGIKAVIENAPVIIPASEEKGGV